MPGPGVGEPLLIACRDAKLYVRPEPGGLRASRNLLLLAVELKEKAAELRFVDGGRACHDVHDRAVLRADDSGRVRSVSRRRQMLAYFSQ